VRALQAGASRRDAGVKPCHHGQGQQQGKARPLASWARVPTTVSSEGRNVWVFCAEQNPSISFPHEIR